MIASGYIPERLSDHPGNPSPCGSAVTRRRSILWRRVVQGGRCRRGRRRKVGENNLLRSGLRGSGVGGVVGSV